MSTSREQAKLRRIGNGRGLLLSKSICNLVGVQLDDLLRVDLENGSIILTPIRMEEGQ